VLNLLSQSACCCECPQPFVALAVQVKQLLIDAGLPVANASREVCIAAYSTNLLRTDVGCIVQVMVQRHREFVIQHNAQCDSLFPQPDEVIIAVCDSVACSAGLCPYLCFFAFRRS
jgi:hypothetical protein